ncbi:MAG: DUF4386 domain-containing protein [Acidobacteria bacterium]|nr:DUF4386 domain-containing protein [Acidobacteriota bacterium]
MTALSKHARIAGFLYILASAIGIVRLLYVPRVLFVHGDAAATAGNIAAHEGLFRLGMLCYLVGGVVWLFVPLALYRLLDRVDHDLAAVMVILGSLMQAVLYAINTVTDAAALALARGTPFLASFSEAQRDGLALLCLNLHHHLDVAFAIYAGLWLLPLGLLVYRSRFLPRFLGVWLVAGCLGWLAFCVTGIMWPESADHVFNYAQVLTLGEIATVLWLLIVGARPPRMAAAA